MKRFVYSVISFNASETLNALITSSTSGVCRYVSLNFLYSSPSWGSCYKCSLSMLTSFNLVTPLALAAIAFVIVS